MSKPSLGFKVSESEREQIENLVETGSIAEAQQIILNKLDEAVGAWVNQDNDDYNNSNPEPDHLEFKAAQAAISCGNVYARIDEDFTDTSQQQTKIKSITHLTRSTGIIRKFFPDRGYGFIKPDCGGFDVWIHKKFCVEDYSPKEGDRVIYLTRLGEKGNFIAKEVDQLVEIGHKGPGYVEGVGIIEVFDKKDSRSVLNQPVIQKTLEIIEGAEPKQISWESGGTLIYGNPAEPFIDPPDYTTPQDVPKLYDYLYGKRS